MLLKTKLPVFVSSAVVPRHSEPKRVLALLSAVSEIREVDSSAAPVILRVAYGGKDPHDYRHLNGRFLKKLTQYTGQSLEAAFFGHFWNDTFVKAARRAGPKSGDVLPRRAVSRILRRGRIYLEIPQMERIGQSMRLSNVGEAEVETARADLASAMAQMLLIDGGYWVPTQEPLLAVDRLSGKGSYVSEYDLRDPGSCGRQMFSPTIGRFQYTMRQLELAREAERNREADTNPVEIDILDCSVFSEDVPIGGTIALLAYLSAEKEVPSASKRRLASFVKNDAEWDWGRASDEIGHLLSKVYTDGPFRDRLELELERIDSQQISIPVTAGVPNLTR